MEEAIALLMEHMPPSKVARVLAAWQIGTSDYLATRAKLFAGATVAGLCKKAKTLEAAQE